MSIIGSAVEVERREEQRVPCGLTAHELRASRQPSRAERWSATGARGSPEPTNGRIGLD
jgi:hypothetical protein